MRKVHPCTVRINVFDADGKPGGQGSGFLYKSAGRLITNYHVPGNAAMAKVRFNDGREYSIKSIFAQKANDVFEAMVDVPPGEVRWLRRAADRGHADAQRSSGLMFFNGEGMPRDKHRACTWMILAAARKNEDAQKLLRLIAAEMTKEEFTAAQEKAKGWKPVK